MAWQTMLPPHLALPDAVGRELELFRTAIGCPDDVFALRILGSGWATRCTQKLTYDQARLENPRASDAELVAIVYRMRSLISEITGQELPSLPEVCKSFDALVQFIIREELRHALPDPFGWGAKIDSILAKAN